MSILEICRWLQNTDLGQQIHESLYLFPLIETLHVLGLALSVGVLFWMDLRLIGVGPLRSHSMARISAALLPAGIIGFVLMFLTGGILFWTQALDAYNSIYFRLKFALLILAGLNAVFYHLTIYRSMEEWDTAAPPPARARIAGYASIVLWTGVIIAGRTMAYNLSHLG
jgi:hypothetical protein